jgi:PAS domain S-box-containing protein
VKASEHWRESVSLGTLTVCAIVGPLLAALGLFVGATRRYPPDIAVLVSAGVLLPALRLGRPASVRRRVIAAILIMFFAAVYLTARAGFGAGLNSVIVTACVLGAIISGRRLGLGMIGLAALAYVIIGVLVVKRVFLLDAREVDPLFYRNWLRMAASTSLLAVLLALVIDFVIRHVEANARASAAALEQLGRAHEALREGEERYRSLADHSLDGVLLTKPSGEILEANPAACRMLQRTPEEIRALGRSGVIDVGDPRLAPLLEERRLNGSARGELTLIRKDGSRVPIEVASAVFLDRHGEPRTSMSIRDLTEGHRVERDLRILAELGAVLSPIRSDSSLDDVAPLVARSLADLVVFFVAQADGELQRVAAATSDPARAWISDVLTRERTVVRGDHPARQVLRDRKPILRRQFSPESMEARAESPEHLRALRALRLRSSLLVPLSVGDACVGAMGLGSGSEPFEERDLPLVIEIGRRCALFIESARLHAAEKEAKEKAEANQRRSDFLSRAGIILASSLEQSAMLTGIVQAAVPGFADWCVLELKGESLPSSDPVAAHVDPEKVPFVLDLSRRLRGFHDGYGIPEVTRSGKSEFYRSVSDEEVRRGLASAPDLAELYIRSGVLSSMVVPVSALGRTIGAIVLNRIRPSILFEDEDLRTAEEFGRRVGLALANMRLLKQAQENDRLKDEFIAMLSHELRNPLAPVVAALDVMNFRGGTAFERERSIISRQVRHLVRLVDDLLDVSRITQGKVQIKKGPCRLSEVIRAAAEMASSLIVERSQHLTLPPDQGLELTADSERLAQAIANLLVNAAKYSPPGGSIIVEASADSFEAVIRVRDSGSGIAPETLPKIFDLFVQGDSSLDRAQGGLGIGLTVVKSVVELHGGSVSARSQGLGHGSAFTIRLPLAASEAPGPEPAGLVHDRPGRTALRALVVDDNEDAAEVVAEVLRMSGCSVQVVHDGACALSVWAAAPPDLVLLDIGLPDINGYDLARRFRESSGGGRVRIVAVSGYGRDSDRLRAEEAGFNEHLVKPVSAADLQGVLARWHSTE